MTATDHLTEIIAGNDPDILLAQAGAKAEGLYFLAQKKFRVPDFYVIPGPLALSLSLDPANIPLVLAAWKVRFQIGADTLWAVRSSSEAEDGQALSYAGQFHTEVNVAPDALAAAVEKVLDSFAAARGSAYAPDTNSGFGIIIQHMLRPDYAGVVFSHDPLSPDKAEVHINLVPGLGTLLVSGQETAFSVVFRGGKREFLNEEESFTGEIFTGKTETLHQSGAEIKKRTKAFFPELTRGVRKLSRLRGYPVDVEFAIAGEKVYWLQVRPITSRVSEKPFAIWDNANISENYPGLTLPLSITFVNRTYFRAYRAMALFLGMGKKQVAANQPLLQNMSGGIYGAMYYHVTAWQQLLYQLPFGQRTSRLITRLWNTADAPFDKPSTRSGPWAYVRLLFNLVRSFVSFSRLRTEYLAMYEEAMRVHAQTDYTSKSQEELITLFAQLEKQLTDKWVAPMLNGFFTMIFFSLLKKMVADSRLAEAYPNFTNDILFAQGDVVSVQIVRDYQALMMHIQSDSELQKIMEQEPLESLRTRLALDFPAFFKQVESYIAAFGTRVEAGELKLEIKNYQDEPLRFYALMQQGAGTVLPRRHDTRDFNWRQVLLAIYPQQVIRRKLLGWLVQATVPRFRDRENFRFMRTKTFGIARSIFRAIDLDLLRQGHIDQAGDALYLHLDEILDTRQTGKYRTLISQRKSQYLTYATTEHANRYLQTLHGFVPEEAQPVSLGQGGKGLGCSSGKVTAPVVLITDGQPGRDLTGCILVARAFEPGWVHLFSQAAGVIAERGNLLSHTAILCREMGIPAIVGAKGLLANIHDGDTLWMNGATGEYSLLTDEN